MFYRTKIEFSVAKAGLTDLDKNDLGDLNNLVTRYSRLAEAGKSEHLCSQQFAVRYLVHFLKKHNIHDKPGEYESIMQDAGIATTRWMLEGLIGEFEMQILAETLPEKFDEYEKYEEYASLIQKRAA